MKASISEQNTKNHPFLVQNILFQLVCFLLSENQPLKKKEKSLKLKLIFCTLTSQLPFHLKSNVLGIRVKRTKLCHCPICRIQHRLVNGAIIMIEYSDKYISRRIDRQMEAHNFSSLTSPSLCVELTDYGRHSWLPLQTHGRHSPVSLLRTTAC